MDLSPVEHPLQPADVDRTESEEGSLDEGSADELTEYTAPEDSPHRMQNSEAQDAASCEDVEHMANLSLCSCSGATQALQRTASQHQEAWIPDPMPLIGQPPVANWIGLGGKSDRRPVIWVKVWLAPAHPCDDLYNC